MDIEQPHQAIVRQRGKGYTEEQYQERNSQCYLYTSYVYITTAANASNLG
jgi:hypothetical protein